MAIIFSTKKASILVDYRSTNDSSCILHSRWFTLFYVWGLIWNSLLLYYFITNGTKARAPDRIVDRLVEPVLQVLYYPSTSLPRSACCCTLAHLQVVLSLLLVCLQTGRRLVESLYLTVFNRNSEMHLLHCVFGFFFYTALGPGILKQLDKGDHYCVQQKYYQK